MEDVGDTPRARYRAFISYSHRDAAFGRRLHGRLERYAFPRRLVGRPGRLGLVPARLSPIFRDREELSAAGDLSAEVRAALAESAVLVVVCSPAAAASVWVGKEIETFRVLHPDRPVLVALAAGEPAEAFHPALISGGGEPLAADFRREGDGPRLALLKLAAGIAGVGLDELVQRDAQRRVARVTAVTAVSVAAMLAMGVMTAIALDARAEAERQRAEAEGLVGFMLTDLRARMKEVVGLDVLDAVNQRALAHYADQDIRSLKPDELVRRASLLHAMGEDDLKRGKADRARALFEEARRTTASLLAADPDNPDRIFAQAQSEFWVASVDYQLERYAAARPGYERYRRLSGRLVALAPEKVDYRRELGFAEGALCALAFKPPRDKAGALRHCAGALASMEFVARATGKPPRDLALVSNRQAFLADAYWMNRDLSRAERMRQAQGRLLEGLMAVDPGNMALKDQWVAQQRALAGLERETGRFTAARTRLLEARALLDRMIAFEPADQQRLAQRAGLTSDLEKRPVAIK